MTRLVCATDLLRVGGALTVVTPCYICGGSRREPPRYLDEPAPPCSACDAQGRVAWRYRKLDAVTVEVTNPPLASALQGELAL